LLILRKQFVLGLWCLTPLSSNIPVLLVEDRSTSRKPPTCRKLFVKWYNCEYLILWKYLQSRHQKSILTFQHKITWNFLQI
jgi:hypothetical protein